MNLNNISDDELLSNIEELKNRGYVLEWHKPINYAGYIYIMVNPAFNNLVKIGYADDIKKRVYQLSHKTAVPDDYHVYATYKTKARLVDKDVHNLIDSLNPTLRHNSSKEFYEMTPEQAYDILYTIAKINGDENLLIVNPLNDNYFINSNTFSTTNVTNVNKEKLSNSNLVYNLFWNQFNDVLEKNNLHITNKNIKNNTRSYLDLSIGKSGSWIGIWFNHGNLAIDFCCDDIDLYKNIQKHRKNIEKELNYSLDWTLSPQVKNTDRLRGRASYYYNFSIDDITDSINIDFMTSIVNHAYIMQKVFTKYIEQYR